MARQYEICHDGSVFLAPDDDLDGWAVISGAGTLVAWCPRKEDTAILASHHDLRNARIVPARVMCDAPSCAR
jgi:hypothetical protein